VKKREHKGFGSTLIERGLSLELEGEVRVDFDGSGLICTMEIPLAAAQGGDVNDAR
jgi:two-component system, chemotaxis family, CheB/CheR fusion protein